MTNTKIGYDASYLDEEEREIMETFESEVDSGKITPPTEAERLAINKQWTEALKESQKRKAITLRIQVRDLSRLKSIAQRKGIPYQTLVRSVLHQFAHGDLIERQ